MKTISLIVILFASFSSYGEVITPAIGSGQISGQSQIVINTLWESSGHTSGAYVLPVTPAKRSGDKAATKADLEEPDGSKKFVDQDDEIDEKDDETDEKDDPNEKKGESTVERMKRENREKIKKMHDKEKSKGESIVEKMKRENQERIKKIQEKSKGTDFAKEENKSIFDLYKKENKKFVKESTSGLKKLKAEELKTRNDLKNKIAQTHKRWAEARKKFLKLLPIYKINTFNFESPPRKYKVSKKNLKRPLSVAIKDEYHIIPGSMDFKIRDQGKRPTCAAFSGIRAIETLLAGSGQKIDLSEQYFYWASKPKCQVSPCKKKGSWVIPGFITSQEAPRADIPLEKDCPYKIKKVNGNETQVPLKSHCMKGKVKVNGFSRLSTLDDVVKALKGNRPVIGGFKLSPNFYHNDGFIGLQNALLGGKMDSHAGGHAITIIGFMKLPKEMILKEGRICLVVANSWTEGWGRGGYACISERWFGRYRIERALVSLDKLDLR